MISTALIGPDAPELRVDTLLFLDARSGPDAEARYLAGHLRGARWIDLERDLSTVGDNPKEGGRHPLPAPAAWATTLSRLGLRPDQDVVVYDDQGGANAAARAWWMLRAVGHERVAVLDGGLQGAVAAGLPLGEGPEEPAAPSDYPVRDYAWPTLDLSGVEAALAAGRKTLIDVRGAARYRGEHEPIDPVAGHIPGAINHPLTHHLDAQGRFLPAETLRAQYEALLEGQAPADLVFSCGSGVTACHGLLAMHHAGLPGAALYVGSFSEWCRQRQVAVSEAVSET